MRRGVTNPSRVWQKIKRSMRPYSGVEAESYDVIAPLYSRDVSEWVERLKDAQEPIVELGSGSGRLSLPIAFSGRFVISVDRSLAMLRRFRRRMQATQAPPLSPKLVLADLAQLPVAEKSVGTFFSSHNSIFELSRRDLKTFLQSASRQLKEDGTLILAMDPQERRNLPRLAHVTIYPKQKLDGPELTEVSFFTWIPRNRLLCVTFTYRHGSSQNPRWHMSTMVEYRPNDAELCAIIRQSGLEITHRICTSLADNIPSEILFISPTDNK